MAQNPPPPPGGYNPPPGGAYAPPNDPYAADRALQQWAQSRGAVLQPSPDLRWYQGWFPCVYLPKIDSVGRELRADLQGAQVMLVEAFEDDPIKRATGENRNVIAFVLSQRPTCRVALRSKQGGGIVQDISSGLGSLFGSKNAGGVLGDPTLEGAFEVTTPSRDEGNAGLPMPLRQMLMGVPPFKGIIETRPGGMLVMSYDHRIFEPGKLDALMGLVVQMHQTLPQR